MVWKHLRPHYLLLGGIILSRRFTVQLNYVQNKTQEEHSWESLLCNDWRLCRLDQRNFCLFYNLVSADLCSLSSSDFCFSSFLLCCSDNCFTHIVAITIVSNAGTRNPMRPADSSLKERTVVLVVRTFDPLLEVRWEITIKKSRQAQSTHTHVIQRNPM